ncbi:MAG TPA: glycosyltransferase family 4 protein [Clostridia bacterium]|nr:glycosyltransferase family 4 protein [Clostridia bacterium]
MAEILLVTPYFWPEVAPTAPLMKALTEDLARSGHHVRVLTSTPSRSALLIHKKPGSESIQQHPSEVSIKRLPNPFARKPGAFLKLLDYAWFSLWVIFRVAFARRVDVCIVSSNPPLLALPIGLIGRVKRFATVYDLQDLFPDSAAAAGMISRSSLLYRMLRWLERWTYTIADCNITICQSYEQHVREIAPMAKVEIVPNWVDTNTMQPVPKESNIFRKIAKLDGRFVVLYAGTIGFLQDMQVLLKAASLLCDVSDISFVIVGEGPQKEEMLQEAQELGLQNCAFFGFQPDELVPHIYSSGDVGVIPMRPQSDPMPSKTWSFMACARPVIASIDLESELATRIRQTGTGMVVPCGDASALAKAIFELYRDPDRREAMGRVAREYVVRNLSRATSTTRYEQLVRALALSVRVRGRGADAHKSARRGRRLS